MRNAVPPPIFAITMTAAFLGLVGCGSPDTLDSESVSTVSQAMTVPRAHKEITDSEDGLFITYWERDQDEYPLDDLYTAGKAEMLTTPGGYTTSVDFTGLAERSNFVVGKGRKPCWGETLDWQTKALSGDRAYSGVYGWLRAPLVEYYIGRQAEGGEIGYPGIYDTSRGRYELQVKWMNQANILNPNNEPHLRKKFLQFNCVSLDGAVTTEGPVDLSEHYAAWERLMQDWWPTHQRMAEGWFWHLLAAPDYCVVSTELFGPHIGSSEISDITFGEYISVTPSSRLAIAEGTASDNPERYEVISTEQWTIDPSSIPAWVTVTPTFSVYAGAVDVSVSVAPNTTGSPRVANLTFRTVGSNKTDVAQLSQYSMNQGYAPPGGGGGYELLITRNGPWTAESSDLGWLNIAPSSGTSGTYGMYLSVSANAGGLPRNGTVTITGGGETKTIMVNQAQTSLVTKPTAIEVAAAGGTASFGIVSNVSWWSAYTTNGGGWLSINPGSESGMGNGTVSFTVSPNSTGQTRAATFTIEGGNVSSKTVFISQVSTLVPPCDPSNRLTNPGFESGTSGWTTWGGSLTTSGLAVRTGAASGKVTNRTSSWQGPVQSLIGKVTVGHTYSAQGWAKVSGLSSQPLAFTLKTECAGSSPTYTSLGSAVGDPWHWARLSGQFTVPNCSLTSLALYIEGPASGTTLYADDVSVAELCP